VSLEVFGKGNIMKIWFKEAIAYLFPVKFFVLAACFRSPAFAYASCLSLALVFTREGFLALQAAKAATKVDKTDLTKDKVERLEAALSAMVAREKARGW
jgi:hypothetical protein